MSCAFLLRPSVWWAKREATQSAEPRVGPDRRLAFVRRRRSTRTLAGFPGGNRRVVQSSLRATDLITFKVETEREDDGPWLAEVLELPGVLAYGESEDAALSKVQALALRVIAERLEHGEAGPELLTISFNAA